MWICVYSNYEYIILDIISVLINVEQCHQSSETFVLDDI